MMMMKMMMKKKKKMMMMKKKMKKKMMVMKKRMMMKKMMVMRWWWWIVDLVEVDHVERNREETPLRCSLACILRNVVARECIFEELVPHVGVRCILGTSETEEGRPTVFLPCELTCTLVKDYRDVHLACCVKLACLSTLAYCIHVSCCT